METRGMGGLFAIALLTLAAGCSGGGQTAILLDVGGQMDSRFEPELPPPVEEDLFFPEYQAPDHGEPDWTTVASMVKSGPIFRETTQTSCP